MSLSKRALHLMQARSDSVTSDVCDVDVSVEVRRVGFCGCCGKQLPDEFKGEVVCLRCDDLRFDAMVEAYEMDRGELE